MNVAHRHLLFVQPRVEAGKLGGQRARYFAVLDGNLCTEFVVAGRGANVDVAEVAGL